MFYFVAGYTENGVPYGLTRESNGRISVQFINKECKFLHNIHDETAYHFRFSKLNNF